MLVFVWFFVTICQNLCVSVTLDLPTKIWVTDESEIYIADSRNSVIRKIDSVGITSTVAGVLTVIGFNGDGLQATNTFFSAPLTLMTKTDGTMIIGDTYGHRIRYMDSSNIITTIIGNGGAAYAGDNGLASNAQVQIPGAVWVDSAGNLYIADTGNCKIRYVDSTSNIITTIIGIPTTTGGYNGDLQAGTSTQTNTPYGMFVSSANEAIYFSDSANHIVRVMDQSASSPVVQTIAGVPQLPGFNGDDIRATSAQFITCIGQWIDAATGDVLVADGGNNRIRKVVNNLMTTVVGNGSAFYNGDDLPARHANIATPYGVALDTAGHMYLSDSLHNLVRRVDADTGLISNIEGVAPAAPSRAPTSAMPTTHMPTVTPTTSHPTVSPTTASPTVEPTTKPYKPVINGAGSLVFIVLPFVLIGAYWLYYNKYGGRSAEEAFTAVKCHDEDEEEVRGGDNGGPGMDLEMMAQVKQSAVGHNNLLIEAKTNKEEEALDAAA